MEVEEKRGFLHVNVEKGSNIDGIKEGTAECHTQQYVSTDTKIALIWVDLSSLHIH